MHKFADFISKLLSVIAGLLLLVVIAVLGLAGTIAGQGFLRTYTIFCEEFRDACKVVNARLIAGARK